MRRIYIFFIFILFIHTAWSQPQDLSTNKPGSTYHFTVEKIIGATDVKNQYHTGTCWSFSAQSFLESELMRMGQGPINLSETWVVRNMYLDKAENYLLRQGRTQFDEGGEPHDVINTIREYGIVPQSIYPGTLSALKPDYNELLTSLKSFMSALVVEDQVSENWKGAFNGILDAYLGQIPDSFSYNGKKYTPQSFTKYLGINPDDYVEITSFTHHPFWKQYVPELADNWASASAYNIPLDDLQRVADNSLNNGYTVEWATDVSEKYFSFKNSLAIVPGKDWDQMTSGGQDSLWSYPVKEKTITQEMRQKAYETMATTDDHGMQLIGMAKDQNGSPYYIVKNSWGTERNPLKGYFFASIPYFRYKTTCIMVNKHAIPADIAQKLGISL